MEENEKIPTLEEVKKYFKNARIVKSLYDGRRYGIKHEYYSEIVEHWHRFIYINTEKAGEGYMCTLWDYKNGYAKIVSYNAGTITLEEDDMSGFRSLVGGEEEETTTLEVDKVYRFEDYLFKYKDNGYCYGFNNSSWEVVPAMWYLTKPVQEATQKEWVDKLLAEANNIYPLNSEYFNFNGEIVVKVESEFRYSNSRSVENITDGCGGSVFFNGVWAQKKL